MGHKRNSNKATRKTFRYGKGQDQKIHEVRNATRRQISETMCADQVSKHLKKYKLLDNYGKKIGLSDIILPQYLWGNLF